MSGEVCKPRSFFGSHVQVVVGIFSVCFLVKEEA